MTTKLKEEFLFKEIVDCHEDLEEFQDYMEVKKGLNLQKYSFSELKDVVRSYKKIHSKPDTEEVMEVELAQYESDVVSILDKQSFIEGQLAENQVDVGPDSIKNSSKSEIRQTKLESIYSSEPQRALKYNKKTVLPALYRSIYDLKKAINVTVRSYSRQQSSSLFKTTFIVYTVETSNGWKVSRRFNEFSWLHDVLQSLYPGFPVPPIPAKTALRSFEEKHLEDRMIMFEMFLNKLLMIPELCSELIVEQFLSVKNTNEFRLLKEKYEQDIKNRENVITTLKGKHILNFEPRNIELNRIHYYESNVKIMETLSQQLTQLQNLLDSASNKCFQVTSTFRQLYFHEKDKHQNTAQIYNLMGEFVSEIGNKIDNQLMHVRGYMYSHCNYEFKFNEVILSEVHTLQKQNQCILAKQKDIKAKIIQSNDSPSKSAKQFLQTKELFEVRLSMLLAEMNRHESNDLKVIACQWAKSMDNYMHGVKNYMLTGADQFTKALCVSEGRKLMEVQYLTALVKKSRSSLIIQNKDE